MKKRFEQLSHTADLQIRVYGTTAKELFSNAVEGMFQVIKPRSELCKEQNNYLICRFLSRTRVVKVDAPDQEALLVDYLSEALYLSDVHNEAYLKGVVHELTVHHLHGELFGVPVNGFNIEIKAVTYHGLSIKICNGIWQADIVFDI